MYPHRRPRQGRVACNVLTGAQFRALTQADFNTTTGCMTTAQSKNWCPTSRTNVQLNSEYYGVKFNGAFVALAVPIPTTYNCTLGTLPGCWWKIRYIINGQANDTTTWSADIIGDPVHLIEDGT